MRKLAVLLIVSLLLSPLLALPRTGYAQENDPLDDSAQVDHISCLLDLICPSRNRVQIIEKHDRWLIKGWKHTGWHPVATVQRCNRGDDVGKRCGTEFRDHLGFRWVP